MLDIKWIRENQEKFDAGMKARGVDITALPLIEIDKKRREAIIKRETLQAQRNKIAKEIGTYMAKGEKETAEKLKQQVSQSKEEEKELEEQALHWEGILEKALFDVPNLPAEDVPYGVSEKDNKEVRRQGKPPVFSFVPKDHQTLGEKLEQMDFGRAAKISGARFVLFT